MIPENQKSPVRLEQTFLFLQLRENTQAYTLIRNTALLFSSYSVLYAKGIYSVWNVDSVQFLGSASVRFSSCSIRSDRVRVLSHF